MNTQSNADRAERHAGGSPIKVEENIDREAHEARKEALRRLYAEQKDS